MIAPARTAACRALGAIASGEHDLPTALARSRQRLADERDRALAAEIVTGTLRWKRSLDHLITHFARRPVARLDPDVLVVLEISLYQLLHLDRVPASAVVDDAVDLTRAARKPSAAGFVNAVLRTVQRERHRLPLPPRPADGNDRAAALSYLGVTHSHPEWLVSRWIDRHGFEATERWVQFNNVTPALTLRANTLRSTRDDVAMALVESGIDVLPTRYAPEGLVVTAGNPLRDDAVRGTFVAQDEASQLVPLVVAARRGEHVLDLCASPGGKTIALAAAMENSGTLVACDIRSRRIDLLQKTVASSGARHVRIVRVDGVGALPFGPLFDRVLVDAPCSGLGTIRRDPDIRWRRAESDLRGLADAQHALLARAAAVVRPGGRLVYATCSSEPEENEAVVDAFLVSNPAFSLVDLRECPGPLPSALVDSQGRLRTLPFAHGLEAFFAAAMVKEGR